MSEERTWGQAAGDVFGNILEAVARGGKLPAVVAAGLEAGINTENFQRRSRLADLQMEQAELEKQGKELSNKKTQQAIDQANELHPYQVKAAQQGVEFGKNREEREEAANKRAQETYDQKQAEAAARLIAIQQAETEKLQNSWVNEAQKINAGVFDEVRQGTGYNLLSIPGKTIIDNDPTIAAYVQAATLAKLYDEDPRAFYHVAQREGIEFEESETGAPVITVGDRKLEMNQTNLSQIMEYLQEDLKKGTTAALAIGGKAGSVEQLAVRRSLGMDKQTWEAFGGAGPMLAKYQVFVENGNFTQEQKMVHLLSSALDEAFDDKILDPEEIAYLTPLFAQHLKQIGLRLEPGNNMAETKVVLRNGTEVPLEVLRNKLDAKDIIGQQWQSVVNQARGNAEAVDQFEDLRKMYGGETLGNLSKPQLEKLLEVQNGFNDITLPLVTGGQKPLADLSEETLETLDDAWNKNIKDAGLDAKKFYSPVKKLLLTKRRDRLASELPALKEKIKNVPQFRGKGVRFFTPGINETAFIGSGMFADGEVINKDYSRLAEDIARTQEKIENIDKELK